MIVLAAAWRWWTDSWRSPRRARWLYAALAGGALALVAVAVAAGDALAAGIAAALAAVTLALAVLARRLARWTDVERR